MTKLFHHSQCSRVVQPEIAYLVSGLAFYSGLFHLAENAGIVYYILFVDVGKGGRG